MSQDQASHLKQVLPQLLSSKSLFLCNVPPTLLSEYALDSRLIYYIPLSPLPRNCFFFNFLWFLFFSSTSLCHHFFFNFLIPPPCLCFFFDFHWFYTFFFSFPSFNLSTLFLCFLFVFSFLNFFLNNFSLIFLYFLLNNAFSLVFFSVYILALPKYFVFWK